MDPTAITDSVFLVAQQLKEQVVRREGWHADMPSLLLQWMDGVMLGACDIANVPPPERQERMQMAVALTDADLVQVVVDAYAKQGGDPAEYAKLRPGDLEKAFRAGDPSVTEIINVVTWSAADIEHPVMRSMPYTWDGPDIVWSGPRAELGETVGGLFVAAVQAGFDVRASRPFPAKSMREVAAITGMDTFELVIAPPPRNGPCPCGSGKKAKFCCWGAS